MAISMRRGVWTEDEHDRFLEAIQLYPLGPWRDVASHVGSRDVRQVQTHAQKYFEKVDRHKRGLRRERQARLRPEHRIDRLSSENALRPPESSEVDRYPGDEFQPIFRHNDPNQPACPDPALSIDPMPWAAHIDNSMSHAESESKDTEFPTLEESLDILMECLSDY